MNRPTSRLGAPELAPLVDELARRFVEGGAPRTLTLRATPETARAALADLLGLDRLPRVGARVSVDRLTEALGLATTEELLATVEQLRGPLPDRHAERFAERSARAELWTWLESAATETPLGDLSAWAARVRAAGVRGNVGEQRRRLTAALAVLSVLPADGLPLAVLASDCAGDPHALDRGRALATLVLDAIAVAGDIAPARDAESARALWESVGVVPDPLSSTVLALGVPGDQRTALGRWLAAARDDGEPVVLTLATLRRWPVQPLPAYDTAYVVENPSLVAAAGREWTGPPIICSSGRPTLAVVMLVRQLASAGATVRQHADFDSAGLAITEWLARRAGTQPWRMAAADYLAAADSMPVVRRLDHPVPATPWDPSLQPAIAERQVAVYEEALHHELIRDMCAGYRAAEEQPKVKQGR